MSFINKIGEFFAGGATKVATGVADIVDRFVQTPEEKAELAAKIQAEVNRHMEAMQADLTKQMELEVEDRAKARSRESDFVKATGHIDWFMTLFGTAIVIMFGFTVWVSTMGTVPTDMKEIFIESRAAVRDIVVGIAAYYWGSSAGSRIKDMRGK